MPEQQKTDLDILKEHHLRLIKFKGTEFFSTFTNILDNYYRAALNELKACENAEARGKLKLLDSLKGEFSDSPAMLDNINFYKELAGEDW